MTKKSSTTSLPFRKVGTTVSRLTAGGKRFPIRGSRYLALTAFVALVALAFYSISSASSGAAISSAAPPPAAPAARANKAKLASPGATKATPTKSAGGAALAAGDLRIERRGHTATRLGDGRILIVGGENENGPVQESEVFDRNSRSFALAARLQTARADHTATRLADGRVLIIGGRNRDGALATTEIFDPAANAFSTGPTLHRARAGHSATALADGRVLIAGGDAKGSAEIFDPSTQTFSLIVGRMAGRRAHHSAALLRSGKVLIAGGVGADGAAVQAGEVFDPETMQFAETRNRMRGARLRPVLRVLPDGKVQVIGGDEDRSMEMFNAEGEYFTAYARLAPDGESAAGIAEVLRAQTRAALIHKAEGGSIGLKGLRFDRFDDLLLSGEPVADLLDRSEHTLTEMPESGEAIVTGGESSIGKVLSSTVMLTSSDATVTTDKTDYYPGETVIITGAGWQPGETVELRLHRDGQEPSADTLLSAVADGNGNIENSQYIVQETDLGVSFLLSATGLSSGYTAQTTFTDSPRIGSVSVGVQSPNQICPGGSATYTVTVNRGTASGNFTANLSITTLLPTGATASFSPASLSFPVGQNSQTSTLTIATTNATPFGSTNFTVRAAVSVQPGDNASGQGTLVIADTTPPVITLNGANPLTVQCHTTFSDPGATATDNCPGSVPVTTSDSVNVNTPGSYTLTYTATDAKGNTATATRTVNVVDTTLPTVTLNGSGEVTVECHTSFSDPGATASDTCAGDLTNVIVATGNVNVNAPGDYIVTYSATDPSGNTGSTTRAVHVRDTIAPTITLNSGPDTVECHTSFTDPGATASDACDTGVSVTPSGSVDVNSPGSYTLTYTATDASGNTTTATRTVTVVDTTAPQIALNGANPATVECHDSFSDPGATANDACAGSVPVEISGSVDVNTPGTYTLTYSATDPSNNSASVTRTVVVQDTTPPVITLNGANPFTVECHTSFDDPGATATDTCAGDLTSSILVSGTVNPDVPGSYTLTYSVSDGSNTSTTTRTVNVVDTTPPVIALNGAASVTIECHGAFTDPGATASDTCAGDLTGDIVVGGDPVNPNVVGTYTITYDVSDGSNPAVTVTRTVNVVDTTPPIITLIGPNPLTVECHSAFNDPGATASDLCSGDLTGAIATSSNVNANAVGSYMITYNVTDAAGNPAIPVTRTVNVVDTTPPLIALNGANPITITCGSSFTDPGATAMDACAGDLTSSILVSGNVNATATGTYVLTYSVSDGAGHTTTVMRTVNVIKANQTINFGALSDRILGESFMLSATASSGLPVSFSIVSGPAMISGNTVMTTGVGTVVVRASQAGNGCYNPAPDADRSFKVLYSSACGRVILPPINPDGSSIFKQKSTVPAKFRVCDVNGMSVGTPGVVSGFTLYRIIQGTMYSEVNEPVDSTTPDTTFRWDPVDQQWIFNISTKNLVANRTYIYRILLNDGTFIEFQFGLK